MGGEVSWTGELVGPLTSGIQRIDVDTQIHGLLRAHPVPDLLDDALHSDIIDLPRLHNLKSTIPIIIIVA